MANMITLTFEPTCPEQAALLGQFLPEYMAAGQLTVSGDREAVKAVVEQAAQAEEKAAKKPRAAKSGITSASDTASSSPAAETSASESAPASADVTLEQVRAKLAALSQAGKAATVKELISAFGVAKLTDVPKDKYPQLLAQAEEL